MEGPGLLCLFIIEENRIGECGRVPLLGRVDELAGGFVHDEQCVILIADIQRECHWLQAGVLYEFVGNDISRVYLGQGRIDQDAIEAEAFGLLDLAPEVQGHAGVFLQKSSGGHCRQSFWNPMLYHA